MKRVEELGISPMPWAVEKGEPVSVMSPLCIVCDTYFNKPDEYTMPNASLIAAAPELYEALFDLIAIANAGDWDDAELVNNAFRKAENAIAKASGEEAK